MGITGERRPSVEELPITTDEVLANGDRLLARARRTIADLDQLLQVDATGEDVVDIRD